MMRVVASVFESRSAKSTAPLKVLVIVGILKLTDGLVSGGAGSPEWLPKVGMTLVALLPLPSNSIDR